MRKFILTIFFMVFIIFNTSAYTIEGNYYDFGVFKIIPPKGWSVLERQSENKIFFKHPDGYTGLFIIWKKTSHNDWEDIVQNTDVMSDSVKNKLEEDYKKEFPFAEKIDVEKTDFSNIHAIKITLHTQGEKMYSLIFTKNNLDFTINYATFMDGYKTDMEAIRVAIDTFEVKDGLK